MLLHNICKWIDPFYTKSNIRLSPNPNVLTELGYAMSHIGNDAVILVFNEFFGDVNLLPFDLRGLRTLTYYSDPKDSDRATPRKQLINNLVDAIRLIGESVRSDPMYKIIYPRTLNVAGQAEGLLRELIKVSAYKTDVETITEKEFRKICELIDPNAKASLIIANNSNSFQHATWFQYMWYHRERSRGFTSDILMFSTFLHKDHVAFLASIEQSSFFNQLEELRNIRTNNKNLNWIAGSIWNYIELCRKLKIYAINIMERRTKPF